GLERRGSGKLRVEQRRSQIGEQAERLTNREQALFRSQVPRQRFVLRSANGSQDDSVSSLRDDERRLGKRLSRRIVARPADGGGRGFDRQAIASQALEHLGRFGNDLGADA